MKLIEKIVRQIVGVPKPASEEPEKAKAEKPRRDRSPDRPTRKHKKRTGSPSKSSAKKKTGRTAAKPARGPKPRNPTPAAQAVDPAGFKDLGLRDEILQAIGEQGYENPTPIQKASIRDLIKGRDLLGCAQTGTGKTAAFALPTLDRLSRKESRHGKFRVLVLTPTRELALQVKESYVDYGRHLNLKSVVVFGGVGIEPQKKSLRGRVDILVATPGRLLDLHSQGCVDFSGVDTLVLDEADRMLDMGFLPDVRRILSQLPANRQNILFSATMPKDIAALSKKLLKNPVKVEVAPVSSASEQVEQSAYLVNRKNKSALLLHVLQDPSTYKVIVFTRTKAIANRVTTMLVKNKISAEAIHGNKSQSVRQRALANFRGEKTRVLVASDLAARGIDVDDITHVINYDVPNVAETYVHRIGRTGRAEAVGCAISFVDGEEQAFLRSIEQLIGKRIPIVEGHPFPYEPGEVIPARERVSGQRQRQKRGRGGSPNRNRSSSPSTKKPGSRGRRSRRR